MNTIIYLRTSTEEQNPENQERDCISLLKEMGQTDYQIFEEKQSAWKDEFKRVKFNEIKELIKCRKVDSLIVWDLDRLFRNKNNLVAFFKFCKIYNCKIFSFRQQFLEDINKAPPPWNEMLLDNMIFILGWIAEEESSKKSERVKLAVRKQEGKETKSYKGNRWGRPKFHTNKINVILDLRKQGLSYREISKRAGVSLGKISEILVQKS